MTSTELKSNLHKLIDSINDSRALSAIYSFVSTKSEGKKAKDNILTHFSFESSLAKDWNKPEEDKAWESL
jgi:hypothetical protein